ncbi:MAG: hypothetical protein JSS29_00530 [Proteobacteria bacterium]|nr:hypothetical protein [Pseudomonadota bacterium]
MALPFVAFARRVQGHLLRGAFVLAVLAAAPHGARAQEPAAPASAGPGALYGPYAMTREGSGTSWQPDSTPMYGVMGERGAWSGMVHGMADLIYDDQGGPRGATQRFSTSMLMLMARRAVGEGALGLRLMLSSDPAMGKEGYPLLFQTGETADGRTPLIDRQHPHDLLMEAVVTYSRNFSADGSLFLYAGLPGEPALGPEAFMHRLSGMDNPEAPISHHWLDSTHVTWGVVTAGVTYAGLKLEASAFDGREPDQFHYNIETGPLDSYSVRATLNPSAALSMQVSYGSLKSPEQLEPGIDVRRSTASVTYNAPWGEWWQTTLAFGHNAPTDGRATSGWLLESAARVAPAHTVFARAERVGKDELFTEGQPLYGESFTVDKLSVGYLYDFLRLKELRFGVGALVSTYSFPATLNSSYGYRPTSFMVFLRARL